MVANRYSVRRLPLAAALLMAATGAGFAARPRGGLGHRSNCRHAADVHRLRRSRVITLLLYRPLSPAIEAAEATSHKPLQQSKRLVYGLAALFGMDSFGTGFLVQSLLALWLYQRFQISVTTAATILFWSGICSAVSYLVAVPIAERIGLINTMVFTHLPSNVLLALVPFAPDLWVAIVLLLARSALSQMDVPTRSSYVMAVVAPEERPAAASVTAVPKTFAWAAGSLISGYLLTLSSFGWPLLIGGVVKGVYDILLLIKFQKVRPPEEQLPAQAASANPPAG